MKKCSFTLLCLLTFSIAGFSQRQGFGIKAGVTSNYLAFSYPGDIKYQGHKVGFVFGFVNQMQVAKGFAVQPGIQVALKGARVPGMQLQTWHIELPVNFMFTHNGFFLGAGGYLSIGLDAKAIGDDVQPDGEADLYAEGEAPPYLFKRTEGGINVLMCYTLPGGFTLGANFSQGLQNLNDDDNGLKIYPRTFGFTVTQLIGKK